MSWERADLWSKAKLFFSKAANEDHQNGDFGLWSAMGLELLARAAVAKVSPTLLAEPDRDQKNIMFALGVAAGGSPKSVSAVQVLTLCKVLVPNFTDEEFKAASSLLNRRNEELHTGAAAFLNFPAQAWLPSFYRCCKVLAEYQGENLESLLGADVGGVALGILAEVEENVLQRVMALISAHRRVYEAKEEAERLALSAAAEAQAEALSHRGHHRVLCPACGCRATVHGALYGGEKVEHGDGVIIVRQSVVPTKFLCSACGLKLNGYGELVAARVADHFTHRYEYTPSQYYELVDPADVDVMSRFAEDHGFYSFSNE